MFGNDLSDLRSICVEDSRLESFLEKTLCINECQLATSSTHVTFKIRLRIVPIFDYVQSSKVLNGARIQVFWEILKLFV